MNDKLLRVGIIGLGVGEKHIDGFESDPRCRVTTLCDMDEEQLAVVGSRHPTCKVVRDPNLVIEDSETDVISIASWDNAHAEQVLKACLLYTSPSPRD